jgi:hypothetical protein
MRIRDCLNWVLDHLEIPPREWGEWRERERFFLARERVSIDDWSRRLAPEAGWDPELVSIVLRCVSILSVDPTQVRPSDRLDGRLAVHSLWKFRANVDDFIILVGDCIAEKRTVAEWPQPSKQFLQSMTLGEFIEYVHPIWRDNPVKRRSVKI